MRNICQNLCLDVGYGLDLYPIEDTERFMLMANTFPHIDFRGCFILMKIHMNCWYAINAITRNVLIRIIFFLGRFKIMLGIKCKRGVMMAIL